jgi:ABC-2 type transport system ATP-binding protein
VESTPLSTLYDRRAGRQLQISVLDNLERLITEVKQSPWVKTWESLPEQNSLKIQFVGDTQASADLLRSLIESGLAVTEFHTIQEDLEAIFLKLGHQQVS